MVKNIHRWSKTVDMVKTVKNSQIQSKRSKAVNTIKITKNSPKYSTMVKNGRYGPNGQNDQK